MLWDLAGPFTWHTKQTCMLHLRLTPRLVDVSTVHAEGDVSFDNGIEGEALSTCAFMYHIGQLVPGQGVVFPVDMRLVLEPGKATRIQLNFMLRIILCVPRVLLMVLM